jgi:enoyl-CoA hydratase
VAKMAESRALIETLVEGGVAVVRLNNPPANALTPSLFAELERVREAVAPSHVRAVIVTGLSRVFSVGGDLNAIALLAASSREEAVHQARAGRALLDDLLGLPKPFIAAVNGLCLGGGLEIALACHLRVCGTRARFGFPELSLGFVPALGGMGRLTRLVGRAKALEMILTGQTVSAQEAYRVGLVNRCVAPDRVLAEARKLAGAMLRAEPAATLAALELVGEVDAEREAELFGSLVASPVVRRHLLDLLG